MTTVDGVDSDGVATRARPRRRGRRDHADRRSGADDLRLELRARARPARARCTTRPTRRSGTASPSSTGRPTSTPRSSCADRLARHDARARGRGRCRARRSRRGASAEFTQIAIEFLKASLSQFMHGEQGAMLTAAKIVETVPVDRRQVLRRDADDGRGPPHRGLRPLPAHQGRRAVPDEPGAGGPDHRAASRTPAGTSPTSACRS